MGYWRRQDKTLGKQERIWELLQTLVKDTKHLDGHTLELMR
jgi:hypothetical protein